MRTQKGFEDLGPKIEFPPYDDERAKNILERILIGKEVTQEERELVGKIEINLIRKGISNLSPSEESIWGLMSERSRRERNDDIRKTYH